MDFFSRNVEAGFQHMCEAVFMRLCQIVGTSIEVAFRRETTDIKEMVERRVQDDHNVILMESGSIREGFRLEGSDTDWMIWLIDHRVIWDVSQSECYYTATKTLILSDNSESAPGFTLLELLTPTTERAIQSACVRMNDKLYISSSLFRGQINSFLAISHSTEHHGPCASGEVAGKEYDIAFCFACDFWPPSASSWKDRCHSWPDNEVDIVRNGCHIVPIGNPLGLYGHEQKEWRISFSLAEHKLVHTMNHYQFLMYGLLKIFLKEVIDKQSDETNKLLCSYHMKTTVFWVIQQNNIPFWCPQDILTGFWVCFKLLLKWVYEGVCPNFFIPQNNLFLSKVHGSAQRSLFHQLHGLYEKGLACLLQSSSIRYCITAVLYNPRLSICTDEDRLKSENEYVLKLFSEINDNDALFTTYSLYHCIKFLDLLDQLIGSPLTKIQVLMLQKLTATVLQVTAFRLQNMYLDTVLSKQAYIADKMSRHLLKLAAKFGWISDIVYIAVYCYKTFRFWKTSSVIEIIKVKLAQPNLIYNGQVDERRYTEAVRGHYWSKKMREAVSENIKLDCSICYINELTPECQSALQNTSHLFIPVFVAIHFVEFLCYRHIDTTLAQAALEELQDIVHHDQGLFVHDLVRDISWQILGICQQMTGNHHAALYSYKQSLQQYPFHRIQTATHMRIQDLHITLN